MVKQGNTKDAVMSIPEMWEIKKLKDVAPLQRGFDLPYSQMKTGIYPVVFSNGIGAYHSEYMIPGPGVVTGRSGTIGKVHFVQKNYWPHNTSLWVTDFHGNHEKYIYYLFKRINWNAFNSGSGVPTLNRNDVHETEIMLPPLVEQISIAAALSDIDDLITNLEKLIAKKKAIKQGAMQELLTGKRRLPGFDGEWDNYRFGDVFVILPNNAFTRAEMSDSGIVKNIHYGDILTKYHEYISAESDEIPYIASTVDLSRFSDKCFVKSGDIIIADTAEDETVGKALEVIGVSCLMLSGQHTMLCRPQIPFAERFLGYYLNSACYHEQLIPYITGTKVSSVSKANIVQTYLRVPGIQEQTAIADILTDMDIEITKLEENLAKYRLVKQGMMSELLTGRIRLTEKEDA